MCISGLFIFLSAVFLLINIQCNFWHITEAFVFIMERFWGGLSFHSLQALPHFHFLAGRSLLLVACLFNCIIPGLAVLCSHSRS